ncbi:unnamed protein product, partial [marine sediment metagenome]
MSIQTVNPTTGEVIKSYDEMSTQAVDKIISQVNDAQLKWRETPIVKRADYLNKVAQVLEKNKEQYATLIALEMGKPISAGRKEIDKCASVCRYYADNGEAFLKPREIKTEMRSSQVHYNPIGIIFSIMPWNFPFWQVLRFAAPNLVAGNAAILSHAPISTGASLALEALFTEAGLPENVFRSVIINNDVAKHIIEHPKVRGVTITG